MATFEDKEAFRKRLRELRDAISEPRRKEAAHALQRNATSWASNNAIVVSFSSIHSEIDTSLLNQELLNQRRLALPRVRDINGEPRVEIFFVENIDALELSSWGILEPNPNTCEHIPVEALSLVLVPGVGFDAQKHRLGYGKGVYDRFLATLPDSCHSIGLGFQEQAFADTFPRASHDVAVKEVFLV